MNDSELWGLVIMLAIVPYALWYLAKAGEAGTTPNIKPQDRRQSRTASNFTVIGLLWTIAFAALLGFWKSGAKPIPSLIVVAGGFALASAVKLWLWPRIDLQSRKMRALIATSALWILSVAAWHIVFGRSSDMKRIEIVALALLPPALLVLGSVLFSWVRGGSH